MKKPTSKIILDQETFFFTKDIGLASVIQSKDFKLIGLNSQNPHEMYFCFENSKGLDEAINKHYQNNLTVNSLTLLSSFRNLKNLIHQNR